MLKNGLFYALNYVLLDVSDEVQYCFESDDVAECVRRVNLNSSPWARGLGKQMEAFPPSLIKVLLIYG